MAEVDSHHTLFIVLMSGIAFGFAVIILYVLSSAERRGKLMRKLRALAPVRKTAGPPMVYQRVVGSGGRYAVEGTLQLADELE